MWCLSRFPRRTALVIIFEPLNTSADNCLLALSTAGQDCLNREDTPVNRPARKNGATENVKGLQFCSHWFKKIKLG